MELLDFTVTFTAAFTARSPWRNHGVNELFHGTVIAAPWLHHWRIQIFARTIMQEYPGWFSGREPAIGSSLAPEPPK